MATSCLLLCGLPLYTEPSPQSSHSQCRGDGGRRWQCCGTTHVSRSISTGAGGEGCPGRHANRTREKGRESSPGIMFLFLPLKRFFFFKKYLFIYYFGLCWVFVSVRGLSLVAASGGHSSSRCAGLSLSRPLLLRSTASRHAGSVVVAHGPSCSAACGIFPDQGSNPCPLHWQADSQPLCHPGSRKKVFKTEFLLKF